MGKPGLWGGPAEVEVFSSGQLWAVPKWIGTEQAIVSA